MKEITQIRKQGNVVYTSPDSDAGAFHLHLLHSEFCEGVLFMLSGKPSTNFVTVLGISVTVVSAIVRVVVGLMIIAKCQTIAGWMFKSEDE